VTEVTPKFIEEALTALTRACLSNSFHFLTAAKLGIDELSDFKDSLVAEALASAAEANIAAVDSITQMFGLADNAAWNKGIASLRGSFESQLSKMRDESTPMADKISEGLKTLNSGLDEGVEGLEGPAKLQNLLGGVSKVLDIADFKKAIWEDDVGKFVGIVTGSMTTVVSTAFTLALVAELGLTVGPALILVAAATYASSEFGDAVGDNINELLGKTKFESDAAFMKRVVSDSGNTLLPNLHVRLISGDGGDNALAAGAGIRASIFGADGNDTLLGAELGDWLNGGRGNDSLQGAAGEDRLIGGEGDDFLVGGTSSDTLDGGLGDDTYQFTDADFALADGHASVDTIIDGDGIGKITFNGQVIALGNALDGVISRAGSQGYFWQTADALFNVLIGEPTQTQTRDLILVYRPTNARIVVHNWRPGDLGIRLQDYNMPGSAENPYQLTNGDDLVGTDGDHDPNTPISGRDTIAGMDGNDGIDGGYGDDDLDGGTGSDVILGGAGNDRIHGGDGDDFIMDAAIAMNWKRYSEAQLAELRANPDVLALGAGWYVTADGLWANSNSNDAFTFLDPNVAPGGNDVIYAGDGNDIVRSGEGNDIVYGENGNDQLSGGADDDVVSGGDGNDIIRGDRNDAAGYTIASTAKEFGDDTLSGDAGDDEILGQGGDDTIYGGSGKDRLWGDDPSLAAIHHGNDYIDGGDDDDYLEGGGGSDTLLGGSGNDTLWGDGDPTVLAEVNHGNDTLDGGDGDDILAGGGGNDILLGGDGADILHGDDVLGHVAQAFHGADVLDGGQGNDYLEGGGGDDSLSGSDGDDTLWGDASVSGLDSAYQGRDILDGGAGNDHLVGGGGADTLAGGDGNDILEGDADVAIVATSAHGNDMLDGGAGDDILVGDGGDDQLAGGTGADTIYGDRQNLAEAAHGTDRLDGGDGNDILYGQGGNDIVVGGNGDDYIDGDDAIVSESVQGNDTLDGGAGNDSIRGRGGNDILIGGTGVDALDGGLGNDEYRYKMGDASQPGYYDSNGYYIIEGITDEDGSNTIVLDVASTSTSLSLVRNYYGIGDVVLKYSDSDSIYVYDGLREGGFTVRFNDGVSMTLDEIARRTPLGSSADDTIYAFDYAETINAGLGSDTVYAGAGDDVIYGGDGNDRLYGEDGNDTIYGENGVNSMYGGNGDDLLVAGAGFGYMDGGEGNDTLVGGAGNDTMAGGNGDDRFVIGRNGSIDTIDDALGMNVIAFSGFDLSKMFLRRSDTSLSISFTDAYQSYINVANLFDSSTGHAKRGLVVEFNGVTYAYTPEMIEQEVVRATSIGGQINGGPGDDHIIGSDQMDYLYGKDGNDLIEGGAASDTLDGGQGNDSLRGGADDDTLSGSYGSDLYLYGLGDGSDRVTDIGYATDMDEIRFDSGIAVSDVTWRRNNNDMILTIRNSGSITLVGFFISANASQIVDGIRFADGTYLSTISMAMQLNKGTEADDILVGLTLDDTLEGLGGNDKISGGDGADIIVGGKGNDELYGQAGNDTYQYAPGDGVDIIDTYAGNPGPGADVLEFLAGISSTDVLLYRGADVGSTTGTGDDLIIVLPKTHGQVTIRNYFQTDQSHRLSDIRFADGVHWDATQVASRATNLAGDATVMPGTAGDDIFVVDNRADVPGSGTLPQGVDTVSTAIDGYVLPDRITNLILTGPLSSAGTGNALSNTITGNDGDNRLSGSVNVFYSGKDTFVGGKGDDVYVVDWSNPYYIVDRGYYDDTVVEKAGEGIDTIVSYSYSAALPDNVEVLVDMYGSSSVFTGHSVLVSAQRWLQGNSLDNTIVGGVSFMGFGLNIDGGTGADLMYGADSNDTFYVDNVGDRAIELRGDGGGTDTVRTSVNFTLETNVENIMSVGSTGLTLRGNSGANQLYGNDNGGVDTLAGGAGDDSYYLGAGDIIVELAGEGSDTVYLSDNAKTYSIANYQNVENLVLTGGTFGSAATVTGTAADNTITGGVYGDTLIGGDGNDRLTDNATYVVDYDFLIGGNGNDTLISMRGDDTLDGGAGDDSLLGGEGSTTYLWGRGDGHDTLVSERSLNNAVDVLSMRGNATAADVSFSRSDLDVVITIDATGDTFTIKQFYSPYTAGQVMDTIERIDFTDGTSFSRSDIADRTGSEVAQGQSLAGAKPSDAASLVQGGAYLPPSAMSQQVSLLVAAMSQFGTAPGHAGTHSFDESMFAGIAQPGSNHSLQWKAPPVTDLHVF
jgi:Ca2+-binding RTX toxin-like protein